MVLVFGGAYQGKLEYVIEIAGYRKMKFSCDDASEIDFPKGPYMALRSWYFQPYKMEPIRWSI